MGMATSPSPRSRGRTDPDICRSRAIAPASLPSGARAQETSASNCSVARVCRAWMVGASSEGQHAHDKKDRGSLRLRTFAHAEAGRAVVHPTTAASPNRALHGWWRGRTRAVTARGWIGSTATGCGPLAQPAQANSATAPRNSCPQDMIVFLLFGHSLRHPCVALGYLRPRGRCRRGMRGGHQDPSTVRPQHRPWAAASRGV